MATGTAQDKRNAQLPTNHPAAQYRDIEAFKRKRAERRAAPEEQVNVAQEVTA